ncbi:MAG: glycosyltransferase, partial [Ginsengibacter sp.]
CVWKLKKIIKKQKPLIIHSHLFYSSLVSRLSCPRDIPLIYSLHNEMSKNVFNNSRILTILEKKTIKKNHSVMAVSKNVLKDYENTFGEMNNSYVIENFILDKFFTGSSAKDSTVSEKLKLIAVGNIKNQKNYGYIVNVFENLKNFEISLDIYGEGNDTDFKKLKATIEEKNLPIFLKGATNSIDKILPDYDLYVSCSSYEGFGISVIEAMASGLPLLLSDLPVYHEVTMDNALFFDVENPMSLVTLIKEVFDAKFNFKKLSLNGIEISKKYTKEIYLDKLLSIYDNKLKDSAQKM